MKTSRKAAKFSFIVREVAQAGSAPGLGPGGRRFESCLPDLKKPLHCRGFSVELSESIVAGSLPAGRQGILSSRLEEASALQGLLFSVSRKAFAPLRENATEIMIAAFVVQLLANG